MALFLFSELAVSTHQRREFIDITEPLGEVLRATGITSGIMTVYSPHTTAAITVNENWDPDVIHDFLLHLSSLVPAHNLQFRHGEGNSDSHILASLIGASTTLIIRNGSLYLGPWQGVYLCEFDGPRTRTVAVHIISDQAL